MSSTDFMKSMKIDDLWRECYSRGIDCYKKRRADLDKELKAVLGGIKRPTALGYRGRGDKVPLKNVEHYLVAPFEKLHEVKGKTMNLFQELPHYCSDSNKAVYEKSKEDILNSLLVTTCKITALLLVCSKMGHAKSLTAV